MPLDEHQKNGLTVKCATPTTEFPDEFMNNLNDIKAADIDKNNIISLSELQNFEGKTEYAQTILELMEKFAQDFRYKNFSV